MFRARYPFLSVQWKGINKSYLGLCSPIKKLGHCFQFIPIIKHRGPLAKRGTHTIGKLYNIKDIFAHHNHQIKTGMYHTNDV